jgi:methylmalonyl-CoA mutase
METQYQRGRIQDQSLHYERLKHDGTLPIVGVNTFLPETSGDMTSQVSQLSRATPEEKRTQLDHLHAFQGEHAPSTGEALDRLRRAARSGANVFDELMRAVRVASLGQVTHALYEVGGRYRRSL